MFYTYDNAADIARCLNCDKPRCNNCLGNFFSANEPDEAMNPNDERTVNNG